MKFVGDTLIAYTNESFVYSSLLNQEESINRYLKEFFNRDLTIHITMEDDIFSESEISKGDNNKDAVENLVKRKNNFESHPIKKALEKFFDAKII